jgi:ParB-like chromosome segregation protein Spo0J
VTSLGGILNSRAHFEQSPPQGQMDPLASDDSVSLAQGEAVSVCLDKLRPGQLLRLGELTSAHIDEVAQLEGRWPPILINRADHSIIDGHYRYFAARRLGHSTIQCTYFDGDAESAFFEAVRRNLVHGLALSLRERERVGTRVLELHPDWSNRKVAEICGLSHMTVGRLRSNRRPTALNGHLDGKRRGRDNKARPIDAVNVRNQIARALSASPEASLRKIAVDVGSSPETVRRVRKELSGKSTQKPRDLVKQSGAVNQPARDMTRTDAALTATDEAKRFSEWFRTNGCADWSDHVLSVPLSRVYEVADEARHRADQWAQFAKALEGRPRSR